jgi:hypothetical protein
MRVYENEMIGGKRRALETILKLFDDTSGVKRPLQLDRIFIWDRTDSTSLDARIKYPFSSKVLWRWP